MMATTVAQNQLRTTTPHVFALRNVLVVVEWGASPANLIMWTLALADPSTRVSVMCALDSRRAAPTVAAGSPQHSIHGKWRPGRNRVVNETCAQLRAGGLHAEPIYRDGPADEAVQWAADATEADLVVVTAAFADRFHGKPLVRLKRAARTSFLFVRSAPRKGSILLADDFTEASREARLFASLTAQHLDSPWRIIPDGSPVQEEAVTITTWPKRTNPMLRSEILGTQTPAVAIADAILQEADAQESQLIVVGNRQRGSVRRLLFGSVSDDVARHARTNVLVATPETD